MTGYESERCDGHFVQTQLGGSILQDAQIENRATGPAAECQTSIAKQVDQPGNALGKAENLLEDRDRKRGICSAKSCRMQPFGYVGANFRKAERPE